MTTPTRRYTDGVPREVESRLREICVALPEVNEQRAWVGTRWQVRKRTFAHVLGVASSDRDEQVVVVFRSEGDELEMLRNAGHPFIPFDWGRSAIGLIINASTDWIEVAELITDSFCAMAPLKLAALVDRPA